MSAQAASASRAASFVHCYFPCSHCPGAVYIVKSKGFSLELIFSSIKGVLTMFNLSPLGENPYPTCHFCSNHLYQLDSASDDDSPVCMVLYEGNTCQTVAVRLSQGPHAL